MYANLMKHGLSSRFEQEAGVVSGKLQHGAGGSVDFPAAGDWVMIDRPDGCSGDAVIHHILSRKSLFSRKAAGTKAHNEQVIAANIDTVFICMSLNLDFSLRRIERYLTIAWNSMALPVIVLTKSDLCGDLPQKLAEIASAARGVDVAVCSVKTLDGKHLQSYRKLTREMSYDGLNSRQLENEKMSRMFGGKAEMKQFFRRIKGEKTQGHL